MSKTLVVEILENLAFLANASNLVLYLSKFMHFSPSTSANIVTNFMGTAFLLALLGGFLADAFFSTYCIYLISAAIEFTVSFNFVHRFELESFFFFSVPYLTSSNWFSTVSNYLHPQDLHLTNMQEYVVIGKKKPSLLAMWDSQLKYL